MNKCKRIMFLSLAVILILSSTYISTFASDSTEKTNTHTKKFYLTEEEVFESLAYTFDDYDLKTAIASNVQASPTGIYTKSFSSENYSQYTNDQYGGMYIDDDGTLVICYVEGSDTLHSARLNSQISKARKSTLVNAKNEPIVNNYTFKAVKYSYSELLSAYEHINDFAEQTGIIQTASIDLVDNKIEIGIIEPDKLNIIYEGLSAIDGMYSVTILDPEEDVFHDIAVINGTSRISNGTSSSTPAGRLYSSKINN